MKILCKGFIILFPLFLSSLAYSESNWELYSKKCMELSGQAALDACDMAAAFMPEVLLPSESAQIFINRGIALGELGRTKEALKSFQKARRLDPANAKVYYNMGVAMDELGYTSKVLRTYRKAVKLDSNIAEAWGNLGLAAFDAGRYEEAIKAFENAQKIDPLYFNNRTEQQEVYKEAINIEPAPFHGREFILRFTPNVGYLAEISSNGDPLLNRLGIKKRLNQFDYILLNTDLDIQIHHNWFATGSFMYSHAFYKDPVNGGIDIFGIPFGVRYVLLESDYHSYGDLFLDRSRYWVGASVGPYVKNESITVDLGGRNTHGTSTNAAVGVGAHIGFDYFLEPNIGLGLQVKFQYINFDDNIIIFSGGPSIIGKF